jgi:hypothetical protein
MSSIKVESGGGAANAPTWSVNAEVPKDQLTGEGLRHEPGENST